MQYLSSAWLYPLHPRRRCLAGPGAIDHFELFGVEQHGLNVWRIVGGALMTGGIVLIAMA